MSRWLNSVNSLLETLDGQVGEVAESSKRGGLAAARGGAVDDILSRRGLLGTEEEESVSEDDEESVGETTEEEESEYEEYESEGESDGDGDGWDEEGESLDDEEEEEEEEEIIEEEEDVDPEPSTPLFDDDSDMSEMDESSPVKAGKVSDAAAEDAGDTGGLAISDDLSSAGSTEEGVKDSGPAPGTGTNSATSGQATASLSKDIERTVPSEEDDAEIVAEKAGLEVAMGTGGAELGGADDIDMERAASPEMRSDSDSLSSSAAPAAVVPAVPSTPVSSGSEMPVAAPRSGDSWFRGDSSANHNQLQKQLKSTTRELKRAQKEGTKLRGHVVSLHTQLESAENELVAQRAELQRAAERLDRDRARHKEEIEEMEEDHDDETEHLKAEHEKIMKEQKERFESQIEELRAIITDAERRRMEEGGDWTKELEESMKREQEAGRKLVRLEDDASELRSANAKLEMQLSATQLRLESAQGAAETASQREREAEEKLDAALSLHARQMSQRQVREGQLERTVAELGAALVVARDREVNRLEEDKLKKKRARGSAGKAGNEDENQTESVKDKFEAAVLELDTAKAQLDLEKSRCETLQGELRDVSREREEEALASQDRQRHHDGIVADLNATVSRLRVALKKAEGTGADTSENSDGGPALNSTIVARLQKAEKENQRQIASLSEQILRQRSKLENSSSELVALKGRLRTATSRAEAAERALAASTASGASDPYDLESGSGGSPYGGRARRRRGGGRGRGSTSNAVKSIRSVFQLTPGRGGKGTEQIGETIDALDSFSVETGAFLRHNPVARALFLLYFMILHIWTFCLVVFHAHTMEVEHGDFGGSFGGAAAPHGPDALLQKLSYRHLEQVHH